MSTDWNVYCRTCDAEHTFSDANHMEETMHALVKHARAIAAMAPALADVDYLEVNLGRYGRVNAAWFAKHLGHELIPRDEYGRCADRCYEYTKCAQCGTNHRCARPLGHEGEHV